MESLTEFISSLSQQTSKLNALHYKIANMEIHINDVNSSTMYGVISLKSILKKMEESQGLNGGAVFNAELVTSFLKSKSKFSKNSLEEILDSVLNVLYNVLGAMPYVKGNMRLLKEASQQCLDAVTSAGQLRDGVSRIYDIKNMSEKTRFALRQFNNDVAFIDARVQNIVGIAQEFYLDMKDMLEIFTELKMLLNSRANDLPDSIQEVISKILIHAQKALESMADILSSAKECFSAPLLHPSLYELKSASEQKLESLDGKVSSYRAHSPPKHSSTGLKNLYDLISNK